MKDKELEALRKKLREKSGSKDPLEFRPPKVNADESREYKLFILPAISKGDAIVGDKKAPTTMEQFFYEQGAHWMDNKRHECPRVHDGETCPLCEFAFDLMKGVEDKKERSAIAKAYLPRQYWAVNVYFLDSKSNPEDLRGKVMWWSAPKTVFEMMEKCILNDDAGDEEYPKAYGAFFDVDSGHVFNLMVNRKGEYNSYEQSGFIGKRRPLAKEQERVDAILAQRIYLPGKFSARDVAVLQKIVDKIEGNKSGGGFDDDEDEKPKQETKKEEKKQEKKQEKPKDEKPKDEKPKEESKDEEVSSALDMSKDPEVEKLLNEFADDDLE